MGRFNLDMNQIYHETYIISERQQIYEHNQSIKSKSDFKQIQQATQEQLIQLSKLLNGKYVGYQIVLGVEAKAYNKVKDRSYVSVTYIIKHPQLSQDICDFVVLPFAECGKLAKVTGERIEAEMNLEMRNDFLKIKLVNNLKCDIALNGAEGLQFFHELFSHLFESDYFPSNLIGRETRFFKNGFDMIENVDLSCKCDDSGNEIIKGVAIIKSSHWTGNIIGKATGNMYQDSSSKYQRLLPRTKSVSFIPIQVTSNINYPYLLVEKIEHGYFDYDKQEFYLCIKHATYYKKECDYRHIDSFYVKGSILKLGETNIYRTSDSSRYYSLCSKRGNVQFVSGDVPNILLKNLKLEILELCDTFI